MKNRPIEKNNEIKVEELVKKAPRKKYAKIETAALNVREVPSFEGKVLGIVSAGEKFELIDKEQEAGFYKIAYDKGIAFVMADFVKIV